MSEVVRLRGIHKTIKGRPILRDIEFEVGAGEVVGIIGANGAGKTTLLRIISGLSIATGGTVEVSGMPVDGRTRLPRSIGVMTERPGFVEGVSGTRNLSYLASIRGVIGVEQIAGAIRRCGLDPDDPRAVAKYSLGMRQRLNLAQALMENPELVILDEPTNGLDPLGVRDVRRIIAETAAQGAGVLLASHLLTEVEQACDRILVIDRGQIRRSVSGSELRDEASALLIEVAEPAHVGIIFSRYPDSRIDPGSDVIVTVHRPEPTPEVIRKLVMDGVALQRVQPARASLEHILFEAIEHRQ
ncbi:MAG: ABC transporter ATP-binding protein [Acidimicrobiia bacterium]|nr:ABC transporter ATP-binding protein [Acidimicrobiia bacterium]MDH4307666.1 ABC transporter ATP-binding protein [Acidimicrobiia bacterium]